LNKLWFFKEKKLEKFVFFVSDLYPILFPLSRMRDLAMQRNGSAYLNGSSTSDEEPKSENG
jgi:hypothetical protein